MVIVMWMFSRSALILTSKSAVVWLPLCRNTLASTDADRMVNRVVRLIMDIVLIYLLLQCLHTKPVLSQSITVQQ